MEFGLLLAALTGVLAAWAAVRVLHRLRRPLPDHPVDRLISAAGIGLVAGRLTAMVLDGVNPVTHPVDILIVRAGVHTGAAAIASVAVLAWWERHRLPTALDDLAPPALAGLSGWHAGCLWRGTCLGTATEVPWAWAQPGSEIARHPVEVYAAVGLVLGALLVAALRRPWLATGVAVLVAAAARLATEPLRPSLDGGPVWWYAAGAVVGIVVATVPRSASRPTGSRSG